MDDPFPHAGTTGPRCSFCGRPDSQVDGEMASGHNVYICASCAREAAALMGVPTPDESGTRDASTPTAREYGAAYLAIDDLRAPLRHLLHRAYGPEVVELVVSGMEWHRKHLNLSAGEQRKAARSVAADCVSLALDDLHYTN